MRRTLLLCTVLSLLLFTNKMLSQADIVGGDDADIQDYPYQAALISTGGWGGGYAYCGASIINEYWIRKNEKVVATIKKMFAAPAISTIPTYINMLPKYKGFRTKA